MATLIEPDAIFAPSIEAVHSNCAIGGIAIVRTASIVMAVPKIGRAHV